MPNFEHFGLGNLATIEGINKTSEPIASVGIMKEKIKRQMYNNRTLGNGRTYFG
ncbi:MAG: hypothetical protein L6V95_15425 [Candidatus Melainabacteria bacterium]|nr:MAG: hypothetical protein L6V95_15425 [Candidatus Melainabacteria bacterium]